MFINIKNFFNKQSIIQLTLFKVIFGILLFLTIFVIFYGRNYWEKQKLQLNLNLLYITSDLQSKIQSQIAIIEELKNDKNLTESQKENKISEIIQPVINNINDNAVGYYDADLKLIIKNNISSDRIFDKFLSAGMSTDIFLNLLKRNDINISLPIYNKSKLIGYVWSYAEKSNYVEDSYYGFSGVSILTLGLSTLIIFLLRKHFAQIEIFLDKFCTIIIDNDYCGQDQVLTKLPELKPVLHKITSYTDNLIKVNEKLESSKLTITKIMEGIPDGFYALDRCWHFTFVNNRTEIFISKNHNELLGKSIWEVFPQVIGSLTYAKMQEAMSQNEAVHWETEEFTSPGRNYEYHAYPFEEGLTVFLKDITESKRQRQELERLERLNLIGQLAAGISHEIRNPLTTVKGFLQFFGAKSKYEQDKEYMDLMISEIDRANTIIRDFLSLAKENLDNIKHQNINEVIRKLFPMLQADAYNNNKEVVLDLNTLPDIMIDENEIKQLILNLVRNGLEVTPEQGCVIISTYQKEDKVVLAIKDQGSGIPQEIQEKIGTPFFTTKETGTGLGLAISIGIAERHKADFKFETGNKGTVFLTIFST